MHSIQYLAIYGVHVPLPQAIKNHSHETKQSNKFHGLYTILTADGRGLSNKANHEFSLKESKIVLYLPFIIHSKSHLSTLLMS